MVAHHSPTKPTQGLPVQGLKRRDKMLVAPLAHKEGVAKSPTGQYRSYIRVSINTPCYFNEDVKISVLIGLYSNRLYPMRSCHQVPSCTRTWSGSS